MHRREHQQRRNGGQILRGMAVAENQELCTAVNGAVGLITQLPEPGPQTVRTVIGLVEPAQFCCGARTRGKPQVFDFGQFVIVNDGELHRYLSSVLRCGTQQIAFRTQTTAHGSHDCFSDRVKWRVCHLSKLLREVIEK